MCPQNHVCACMCACECYKTLMCAPKLACVFVCALLCASKLVFVLVCAPKLIWALKFVCKIYIYIYLFLTATPQTPSSLTLAKPSSWPQAFGPLAITILSHHSFACRCTGGYNCLWQLWVFFDWNQALSLIVRPYADSSKSYATTPSNQFIKCLQQKNKRKKLEHIPATIQV